MLIPKVLVSPENPRGEGDAPSPFSFAWKPANKKSSPKWDLLQENLAEGGEKEVQHK